MDNDQILKKIEWLDEERRKDKERIKDLEKNLLALEGKLDGAEKGVAKLDGDLTRIRTSIARVDDFEDSLAEFHVKFKKDRKEIESDVKSWIEDAKKVLRTQIQGVEAQIKTIQEDLKQLKKLEKEMDTRIKEDARIDQKQGEMERILKEVERETAELLRQAKLANEARQKELKQLTDIQGEHTALRKRVDEQSGKLDLVNADYQKIQNRLEGLEGLRRELRKDQESFMEETALRFTERDNTWKTWESRFDKVESQSEALEEKITQIDETHRDVKRMQKEISGISELLDRRVNEITEMQRLAEERFRNEWSIFTADDQKRWTNYTLSQKEQFKDLERLLTKTDHRIEPLEDGYQAVQEHVNQLSKVTESNIQALLDLVRDWAVEYERVIEERR